jgi:hypothetical protein
MLRRSNPYPLPAYRGGKPRNAYASRISNRRPGNRQMANAAPGRQSDNRGNVRGRKADRQGKSDDAREFSRPERGPDISHQTNISTIDPNTFRRFADHAAEMEGIPTALSPTPRRKRAHASTATLSP